MTAYGIVKVAFVGGVIAIALMLGLLQLVEKRASPLRWFLRILLLGMITLAVNTHVIEPNWIQVRSVEVKDPELAAVLGETRLLHISDIHIRDGLGFREKALIRKVNAQKPDILMISGDLLDRMDQVAPARELLESFDVKLGIFLVPGNTDHLVMGPQNFKQVFTPAGVNVLINETRKIRLPNGKDLWIVGVDDPKYNHAAVLKALEGIPPAVPKIMLAHSPVIFDRAALTGMDLVLVGDTHGGQIGIDLLVRNSNYANRTPYMRGLFEKNGTKMYVNRGIGMKTLYIRFLCRPEIAVIKVKP